MGGVVVARPGRHKAERGQSPEVVEPLPAALIAQAAPACASTPGARRLWGLGTWQTLDSQAHNGRARHQIIHPAACPLASEKSRFLLVRIADQAQEPAICPVAFFGERRVTERGPSTPKQFEAC